MYGADDIRRDEGDRRAGSAGRPPIGGGRYTEQTEEIQITVKSLILAQDER